MNCFPHKNEWPAGADHCVQNQNSSTNFTPEEKRLSTLIARMELAGHQVHKTPDGFVVVRWGMSRLCTNAAELESFGRILGVQP
jgi:hypothetical protein